MANLSASTKIDIAFKKSQGKATTNETFNVSEEGIFSTPQLGSNLIFSNVPTNDPENVVGTTAYNTDGIIERITFEVVLLQDTLIGPNQSQGWALRLPADYTFNGALNSQYSSGQLLYETLGDLQLVSPIFGKDYEIEIRDNFGQVISPTSPLCPVFDYVNGILFIENPDVIAAFDLSNERPVTVRGYLYVGEFVNEALLSSANLITGATNGLTLVDSNVEIGGTLTGDTTIDLDTNNLEFTNGTLLASGLTQFDIFDQTITGFTTGITSSSTVNELVTAADIYDFVTGETIPAGNTFDIQFNQNNQFSASTNLQYVINNSQYLSSEDFGGSELGTNPSSIALDTVNDRVYILSNSNDIVRTYELSTGTYLPAEDFGNSNLDNAISLTLHINNDRIYIADNEPTPNGGIVKVFELSTGTYLPAENFGGAELNLAQSIALDDINNRAYVLDRNNDVVRVYDISINTSPVYLPAEDFGSSVDLNVAQSIKLDITNSKAYIVDAVDDNVKVYDLTAPTASPVIIGSSVELSVPRNIELDINNDKLYVVDVNDVKVYKLSTGDYLPDENFGSNIELGNARAIALDLNNNKAYVTDGVNSIVRVYQTSYEQLQTNNLQVNNSIEFTNLSSPSGQYVLVIDNTGEVSSLPFTDIDTNLTATNGLSIDGDNVVLGGTLTGDTTIDGDNNELILTNFGDIVINSNAEINIESLNDNIEIRTTDTVILSGDSVDLRSREISFDFSNITAQDRIITGFTTGITLSSKVNELVTAADVYDSITGATQVSNGLRKNNGIIELGGELNKDVIINGLSTYDFGFEEINSFNLITDISINIETNELEFNFTETNAQDRTITGFTTGITSSSTVNELVTAADVYDSITGATQVNNGLTNNNGIIELGGDLTRNTIIDGGAANSNINFRNSNRLIFRALDDLIMSSDNIGTFTLDNGLTINAPSIEFNLNGPAVTATTFSTSITSSSTANELVTADVIFNAISAETLSFSDGLTKTGTDVVLSGSFNSDINLSGPSNSFNLTGNVRFDVSDGSNDFIVTADGINGSTTEFYTDLGNNFGNLFLETSFSQVNFAEDINRINIGVSDNIFTQRSFIQSTTRMELDASGNTITFTSPAVFDDIIQGDVTFTGGSYNLIPAGSFVGSILTIEDTVGDQIFKFNSDGTLQDENNATYLKSDDTPSTVSGSSTAQVTNIVSMTQADYDALVVTDPATLYLITT